jgi:O-antigen ligase
MPFVDPITPTTPTTPTSSASPAMSLSGWLPRAARAALAVLAFALPFELVRPLGHIGPLQLTSVELVLYVALAISAIAILMGGVRVGAPTLPLPNPPAMGSAKQSSASPYAIAVNILRTLPWRRIATRHAGVAAFALVLLLSAARAPLARPEAIKFALRNLGGIALYVAAANLLRAPRAALTTCVAMAIGAVVAASLMWAELHVPGAAGALMPFHARSFDVFGLPRASGPFQYPNIAAMYLEGALPVALAAGVALDAHRRFKSRWGTVAATIAAAVLVEALSLTASRAAMVTVVVVIAAVGLHAVVRKTPGRWRAPVVLAVVGLLAAANSAIGSLAGVRMKFWNDGVWYRSAITAAGEIPDAMGPRTYAAIDVDVRNNGVRPWPATGAQRVALAYHWYDETTGKLAVFDGIRTALPRDIDPGVTVRLSATVLAPARPARYRLHLELVHEGITWFGEQGDAGYDTVVDVREAVAVTTPRRPAVAATVPPAAEPPLERATRMMLWRAAVMAWREHPLLGLGPDNFRRAYNRYLNLPRADERLHANNMYFETLASLGLAGIAALALVIAGFVSAARRAVRLHGASSAAGLLAVGAVAGLGAYAVHGFFDYFLEFTPTYALLWLLGGLLMALSHEREGERTPA